jgi:hypothetical protein
MKHIYTAVLATLISTHAQAGWDSVQESTTKGVNDQYFYSAASSSRYNNTFLLISAAPADNCRVKIGHILLLEGKYQEEDSVYARFKFRIDGGKVHAIEDASYGEDIVDIDGAAYGRQMYQARLTDAQLKEVILGQHIITNGEFHEETDKISLNGSSRAVNDVLSACRNSGGEWGSESRAKQADEWGV